MSNPILTSRLILRMPVPSDAEAMFHYRASPEVTRFQHWEPASAEEVGALIASLVPPGRTPPGAWSQAAITLREGGRLVGDCGVRISQEDPRVGEIGISLDPAFQGRGLATEALGAWLDHLFVGIGLHRVFASVDPRNAASLALMRRAGLRQEAHFKESVWFKGAWADDVVFGLLGREWPGARGGGVPMGPG